MHMRRKPWARPELEACPYYRQDPRDLRGRWAGPVSYTHLTLPTT